MFEKWVRSEEQNDFWISAGELPAAIPDAFYRRVNATLERIGFAKEVWAICEPAYADASRGGRPGGDPGAIKAVRRFDRQREGRKTSN